MINEGAKIVEIISGDIKESDLILPKSIISFTMRENTTLESIPSNAFSHNSNLQIVNIYIQIMILLLKKKHFLFALHYNNSVLFEVYFLITTSFSYSM